MILALWLFLKSVILASGTKFLIRHSGLDPESIETYHGTRRRPTIIQNTNRHRVFRLASPHNGFRLGGRNDKSRVL